ncbi:hypothetical protein FO519_006011 [Halicephalobus sp. NKZ332]|nr:hypothetical protein FO519_006011 [Halicephalobus sp. NKZ332]
MFYFPSNNLHFGTPPSSQALSKTRFSPSVLGSPGTPTRDYRADLLKRIDLNPGTPERGLVEVIEEVQNKCCTAAAHLLKSHVIEAYEIMMKLRYELLAYSKIEYFISKKEFRQKCIQSETFLENIEVQVDRLFFKF